MAIRKKLILALFSTALTVGWAVASADMSWAGRTPMVAEAATAAEAATPVVPTPAAATPRVPTPVAAMPAVLTPAVPMPAVATSAMSRGTAIPPLVEP